MTEIIKHHSLSTLVESRNKIVKLIEATRRNLAEIESLADTSLGNNYLFGGIIKNSRLIGEEHAAKHVDKHFWDFVLRSSRLSNAMTATAKSEMEKKLDTDPPPFEVAELEKFVMFFQQYYGDNALQTIKEVYRKLIGCYYKNSDWHIKKHDNLRKVERTFRIAGPIEWWMGEFRYRDWTTNSGFDYEDLLTACNILDAKGRPDYDTQFRILAREQLKDNDTVVTPYFTVKAFKIGNQIVTWTRLDILRDFNKYGGEGSEALPDLLRKKYKAEHCS